MAQQDENKTEGLISLGEILKSVLGKTKGPRPSAKNSKIWELWPKVVGPQIAKHAQPQSIYGGRLYVGTSDSAWVTELSFRREKIRQRLNQELGVERIKEIIVRISKKV